MWTILVFIRHFQALIADNFGIYKTLSGNFGILAQENGEKNVSYTVQDLNISLT